MNSRPVYVILSFLALVCVMGLSESSAQRNNKSGTRQQTTPAASPTATATATASPAPTPPEELLNKIKATINGYSQAREAGEYERTLKFGFKECNSECKPCTLLWEFEMYGETPSKGERTVERFAVEVALSAIEPKRVFIDETQVEFGTKNGQSITVKMCKPKQNETDECEPREIDYTDSWQISVRSEDGAKRVADLLKRVLNESCINTDY